MPTGGGAPYHLVAVDAAQRALVDGGRVSAEAVVEAVLGRVLARHARQLLLDALQHADGGRVGLYHHVQLREARVTFTIKHNLSRLCAIQSTTLIK